MSETERVFDEKYCVDKPCQLCGTTEKVTIFCGGPVAFMCQNCYRILKKYWTLKKRFEAFHERRRFEVGSQIFFRKTFDDDPVQFVWA